MSDEVEHVNLEDEDDNDFTDDGARRSKNVQASKDDKPLLHEVDFIGAAGTTNPGGAKVWVCKHCHQKFTSSYTRIHIHFFGAPVGKPAGIKRCIALLKDRVKYESLLKKVKIAEQAGVSRSLKNSVINKKQISNSKKPLELAEIAKKVLSQPISSSSAERNWSTYSYIHNVKRNRLNSRRADKLVFIHSNIRLLSRFSESYTTGPYKKWDVNPESSYLEGSSSRLEEMQWENLVDLEQVANDEDEENGKRQRKE